MNFLLSLWSNPPPHRCCVLLAAICGVVLSSSFDNASASSSGSVMCNRDYDTLSHNTGMDITVTCRPTDDGPDTLFGIRFSSPSSGSTSSIVSGNSILTIHATTTDDAATTTSSHPYQGITADGWSLDLDRSVHCDHTLRVDSYSIYDAYVPDGIVDHPENLDQVNWLINNHPIGSHLEIPNNDCNNYNGPVGWKEYQAAVWNLLNDLPTISSENDDDVDGCVARWLEQQARDHGGNYGIECSSSWAAKTGVLLTDSSQGGGPMINRGVILVEIPLEEIGGICNCLDGNAGGDPHFRSWSGELYDFHGVCDLVLLKNPGFMDGRGLDVHIRSKRMKRYYSYISIAAVRIGSKTFEVAAHKDGDTYWLDGVRGAKDGVMPEGVSIAGYWISFRQVHANQREYAIRISDDEQIVFGTWKNFVRVDVRGATAEHFRGSLGLMGSYDERGLWLGRDGSTVFDDVAEYGLEWQVTNTEMPLFHEREGPQHPQRCEVPSKSQVRRRLAESLVTQEEAFEACRSLKEPADRDLCVFDVMATNDKDMAEAY